MSFSLLVKKLENAKVNEAIIINEVLKNTKDIMDKKILLKDIAERVHISHSTVSRLISKYGWSNWSEFVNSCIIEDMFYSQAGDSMVDKMFIQSTFLKKWIRKNQAITNSVVSKMKESKLLLFFGERISGNIAQYLSFMMAHKNIMTVHYFFEHQILPLLGKSVTLFILTSTQRTNYQHLIDYANKRGAEVILIDSSFDEITYTNSLHIKLPLISYVSQEDVLSYLKVETLREYLLLLYEKM